MAPKARTCAHCGLKLGGAKVARREGKQYHSKCWVRVRNRVHLGVGVFAYGRGAENKASSPSMDPHRAERVEMYARLAERYLPLFRDRRKES